MAKVEVDAAKVEVFKVWYALFCTLMDSWTDGELTDLLLIAKLNKLRNELVTRMPEVEAHLMNERRKPREAT